MSRPSCILFPSLLLIAALAGCGPAVLAAADVPPPARDLAAGPGPATAVLAAGCFWCVEAVFEELAGVTEVVSGYAGGTPESAEYEEVSAGHTDHAEAVRITYDPAVVSYGRLLQVFFATHDPTTRDRQGPDWGRQYRSAIFFASAEEKAVAQAYIRQLEEAKAFTAPIVTALESRTGFYPAEAYHQDYVSRHPDHPYVRTWAVPKVQKVREKFADLRKGADAGRGTPVPAKPPTP